MESAIIANTLTDGSKVFDVVFVDGSQKAVICCADERGAERVQLALQAHALEARIDPL